MIALSKIPDVFFVQAEQLESISRTTVEAAENVSEGNEQIKGVSYPCNNTPSLYS